MTATPDFVTLIAEAQANRRLVSLERVRSELGDLFDEHEVAHETLFIRGDGYALTPTAWVRLVRRAQTKQDAQPS